MSSRATLRTLKPRRSEAQLLEPRRLFSFYAAGDYLAGPSPMSGPNYSPPEVVAADLNGDGRMDLAVSNWSDQVVKVLLGNVQRNEALRALVRYSIRSDERQPPRAVDRGAVDPAAEKPLGGATIAVEGQK